jgi:hypothetical protein
VIDRERSQLVWKLGTIMELLQRVQDHIGQSRDIACQQASGNVQEAIYKTQEVKEALQAGGEDLSRESYSPRPHQP